MPGRSAFRPLSNPLRRGTDAHAELCLALGEYRLETIRRRGGICIDQAYYASACAKALGIPSMMFAGLGKDGGHSWVGYLRRIGGWDFSVGRPPGQGLATGETMDPENWTPVTDHDMESMITGHDSRHGEAAGRDLAMAGVFRFRNNAIGEGSAIRSALSRDRRCPEIWDAYEDWLFRTGASSGELKAYHEAAIRSLSYSRDLKARHQEALARLDVKTGDRAGAELLDRRILEENKKGRTDLSAAATARLLTLKMEAGDPEAALREYRKELSALGNGGSDFFYRVTMPLCGFLISKGRPDLSRRVLKEAYDVMKPRKGACWTTIFAISGSRPAVWGRGEFPGGYLRESNTLSFPNSFLAFLTLFLDGGQFRCELLSERLGCKGIAV